MKSLGLFLTCLAVASAQDFSDCTREVERIVDIFSTPEIVTGLSNYLSDNICTENSPTFPEQQICKNGVIKRWPEVTAVFVNHKDIFAQEACTQAIPFKLDWNCETCRHRIGGLLRVMRSYSFFRSFMEFAQGPEYCQQEGLSDAEQTACKTWLEKFLSPAFFVIRGIPTEDICDEMYGMCKGMIGCRDGMRMMYEQVGNDAAIARTETLLKAEVCPQAWVENQQGCEKGVDAHWSVMAKEIANGGFSFTTECANFYDFFAEPEADAAWDCSNCQMRVREVMRFHINHQIELISASIDDIIYNNPLCNDVPNKPDDTLACHKYVRAFVPRALQAIHDDGFNHPDKLCRNIFNFGAECVFEEATTSTTTTTTTTATTTTTTTAPGNSANGHANQIASGLATLVTLAIALILK